MTLDAMRIQPRPVEQTWNVRELIQIEQITFCIVSSRIISHIPQIFCQATSGLTGWDFASGGWVGADPQSARMEDDSG